MKSYNDARKSEFLAKAKNLKLSENDNLKDFYVGLDNEDDLTSEQVEANMLKLSEHEKLGVFKDVSTHVASPSTSSNENETEAERYARKYGK